MKTARLPQFVSRAGAAVFAAVLAAGSFPATAATIDDFATAQAQLSAPPAASSTVAGAGILGGQRDLQLTVHSGAGPATVEVTAGLLQLDVTDTTPDTRARSVVIWDGDADPDTLDPVGLGGVDLTAGDHTGFRLTVDAAGAGTEVVIEVYTDGANASKAALLLPAVAAPTTFDLSYSSFVPSLGTGAVLSNVGAITMSVTSLESAVDLAGLVTAGPVIAAGSALKVDALVVDNDGDGRADPGDTLRYTITITNTGAEATSVSLADVIQPNLTTVTDSLFSDPIAVPDTYLACGNVTLAVDDSPALPGLTANDHDPDGESFSITTVFPLGTDQGGTVDNVDASTGTFDYVPPAGFRGVDSFSYDIEDIGGRTSTATATLIVDSLVWFVDNTAAGGGSGQQASPFNTLGDAESASGPGDTIFVFAGSGDTGDGITLKNRQQLIGEGVGLNACGTLVVPPGARPTLVNSTSTVVTLADGNRIAGLNIEPVGSEDAIVGNGIAGLDVVEVGIDTSRGMPDSNGGVRLSAPTGTMAFDQLSVTGAGTGTAFTVTGGDAQITVASSSLTPTGGSLLSVAVTTGGFVNFQPTSTLSLAGGTGNAVSLQTNVAAITLSSLGSLATTGGGLLIGGNSAVNLGAISSITATGGAALAISGSTVTRIGGGPLTIGSLTSTGSPGVGVTLSGVAPGLTVAGSTMVMASTSHGIDLGVGNGPVSFNSVTIDQTGASGLAVSGNTASIGISGGTIGATTPPAANGVDIDGGNGDITIAASINGAATARSVEISNRTGGSVTLSGAVTDPGLGIDLAANGMATITFAGPLNLNTSTNTAFNATGGGAVQATGAGSTIATTTGVGVNIVNTAIGASGLTFQSVSSNGAANGIVLTNTGIAGGLTVTGTGGAGSGGTIQNAMDAVSLTDASKVTLGFMNLTNNSDSAITGSNVTDLVLNGTTVSASGNAAGENSIDLTNLRGTANAFTNSTITASATAERAVSITNTVGAGTADVLTITGSTIQGTYASLVGADLLEINLTGTANLSATITGATFADGRTNGIQMLVTDATGELNVSGCSMTNQGIGIDMIVSGTGSLTFDVSSNPNITARLGYGTTMVNLFTDGTASAEGRVNDNPNIVGGGSATSGTGIRFNINGSSTAVVEADNNVLSNFWFDLGIDAVARGGDGRLDATITNNTVTMDTSNSLYNIRTQAQDSNTVCANLADNSALGVGMAAYRQRTSDAGSKVYLEGFTTDAATTWTGNGNTGAPVSSSNSGTLSAPPGPGTCTTVP